MLSQINKIELCLFKVKILLEKRFVKIFLIKISGNFKLLKIFNFYKVSECFNFFYLFLHKYKKKINNSHGTYIKKIANNYKNRLTS